jgi:hypothetical protein
VTFPDPGVAESADADGFTTGDVLAAKFAQYGLDARARSALRAYSAHDAGAAAHHGRIEALEDALLETHEGSLGHLRALRQFTGLFASLPEADFSADWLQRLADAWQALRADGAADDLPARAARALVAHGTAELLRERSSLSALEVEIVGALTAAAICVVVPGP